MNFLKKLFKGNKSRDIGSNSSNSNSNENKESYIQLCLDNKYQELEDNRWFSNFNELPQIDQKKNSGAYKEALKICMNGLKKHPDSFLFYGRAADLYDLLNKPEESLNILKEGLEKSLCKSSIAKYIADRAFKRNDYREAVKWWAQSCVMQLESDILVEYLPFLNLSYLCNPIGISDAEEWYLSWADRISSQGPIRFDSTGSELRYNLILNAKNNGDDDVINVLELLYKKYK